MKNPILNTETLEGRTRAGEPMTLTVREVSVGELPILLDAAEKMDDARIFRLVVDGDIDPDSVDDATLAAALEVAERLNFPKLARWIVRHVKSVVALANLAERLMPYGQESLNSSTTSQPRAGAPTPNSSAKRSQTCEPWQRLCRIAGRVTSLMRLRRNGQQERA